MVSALQEFLITRFEDNYLVFSYERVNSFTRFYLVHSGGIDFEDRKQVLLWILNDNLVILPKTTFDTAIRVF